METTCFTFAEFGKTRQAALREINFAGTPNMPPPGWSIHPADPAKLLQGHDGLRLKKDFELKAYRYFWGNGGYGKVWALPKGAAFPEPSMPATSPQSQPQPPETLWSKFKNVWSGGGSPSAQPSGPNQPPKPPAALADFTEALEGDGTPWSYLCASILVRDLASFGESWHNKDWSAHSLLDTPPESSIKRNPWKETQEASSDGKPAVPKPGHLPWTVTDAEPSEWRPSVAISPNEVIVTFYTYLGRMREGIYRHVDRYQPGKYTFKTEEKKIAEGMGGYHN